jgi:hypothetical protein
MIQDGYRVGYIGIRHDIESIISVDAYCIRPYMTKMTHVKMRQAYCIRPSMTK